MNRQSVYALGIVAVLMVLFIFNRDMVEVDLVVIQFKALSALVFMGFTAVGVLIGVLLK